jgi:hypothetical protein
MEVLVVIEVGTFLFIIRLFSKIFLFFLRSEKTVEETIQ